MRYLIIDLEATCWEKGTRPTRQEIIEIGAVMRVSPTDSLGDEFSTFVHPIDRPVLSDFCRTLTSITQADVDHAESFDKVFQRLIEWIGPQPFQWCSWGAYDLKQFRVDCRRHNIAFPKSFENHTNLKKRFAEHMALRPGGMREALHRLKLPLVGTHHRGIDDARNIARIVQAMPELVE